MRIRSTQKDLEWGTQLVSRAISTRSTMPILGTILLQTRAEGVNLSATDLEVAIQATVPAFVEEGGALALPAKLLVEILNNLPSDEVEIRSEVGTTQAEIICRRSSFEIMGMAPEDFPSIPEVGEKPICRLPADLLRTMIRQTIFACSTDETRPHLTGINFVVSGRDARMVATDGGRLALRKTTLSEAAEGSLNVILPQKAMHELTRALGGILGDVEVAMAGGQVAFLLPRVRILTRTIAGTFPNYEQIIPHEYKQRIRVATGDFLAAVRRASITARDSSNVVQIHTVQNTMIVTSNTPEVGRAREEVEVESSGEPIQVAFNARYLLDALTIISSEYVFFDLTGPLSPGVLRPTDFEDYLYILAPVRIYA
ncbi:MAG: DNA polymerase III subunit beta [Armatimonadota bacterium]|nr:DNA polymerase III subunit beta [Armatimonadota bacterium]MDR5702017.1 DNA polymerase III subunit beta [Armatimonadota bacterium]MDR7434685.1 DNA polymerase III subunit beta [Armatimonadota bacterium]